MTQNRSHAVMQQRHEAHDSLDDFPTPPWATRALMECVLGCNLGQEIREYYEKNKAQFRVVELPGDDADKEKPADEDKPAPTGTSLPSTPSNPASDGCDRASDHATPFT